MYAVVQIGSTILRSECITTLRTVSARAEGTALARHHRAETATHAATHRRTNVIGSSSGLPGIGLAPGGGLRRPSACRQARGNHTARGLVNAAAGILPRASARAPAARQDR